MTKRMDNKATYEVTSNTGKKYFVTLINLKNDVNGNLRYEANIISLNSTNEYHATFCYRFTGHYAGDKGECEYIVNYHENKKN